jgi:hypothetical protein
VFAITGSEKNRLAIINDNILQVVVIRDKITTILVLI